MFTREQELQSYIQRLEILHELAVIGTQAQCVKELLQRATQILNDKVYTDSFVIGLVDEDSRLVRFFTPNQPNLKYPYPTAIPLGKGIIGEVLNTRKPLRIIDIEQAPRYIGDNPNIRSELCIPLVTQNCAIGVINAESIQIDGFSECDEKFLATIARQLVAEIEREQLFFHLQQSNSELNQAYDTTLLGWVKVLEIRDNKTKEHSKRVAKLAVKIARATGIAEEEIIHIYRGAILHDIGKMGIPDGILHKKGNLTNEEWNIMRTHPIIARDLLENIPFLQPALDIPYLHHEKWDGTGYPLGLKGKQIPLAARIFAVVDVWDSLLSDRPYRCRWSEDMAREYIIERSGKHFDPEVVEIFIQIE